MKRVVITGMGMVFSDKFTKESFFEALCNGKTFAQKLPDDYCMNYRLKTSWYVPFPDIEVMTEKKPEISRLVKRANRSSVAAVYSAIDAVRDAGFEKLPKDTGVIMGNALNTPEIVSDALTIATDKRISPMAIPRYMPNACAANISIFYGLNGESKVISTACASGTDAVGTAAQSIMLGKSNVMIAGGAECFSGDEGLMIHGFDMLKTLTGSDDGEPVPFCQERSGFLYSEGGSCCLVLEELEHALARNAGIYAEITGYACNSDGYHITGMPEYPENGIRMVKKLSDGMYIDYYNAHGTGTVLNDSAEAALIHEIWSDKSKQPHINSTKGIMGHTFSASGAIEAAVCAWSIKNGIIHRNVMKTPIEGICLSSENIHTEVRKAITASFGFGGHNAALRLEKY